MASKRLLEIKDVSIQRKLAFKVPFQTKNIDKEKLVKNIT